jgi:hypothetical protein
MSIKIQSECWKIKLPPTQKLVLICLSEFADDNGRCYPSVDTIAERTGLNSRSVRRAISEIEKAGILTRSFCTGKRTDYIINPCHSVTPGTVSPLTESTLPLSLCPIPLTESTLTPDRGVNITTINHQEPSLTTITNNAPAKAVSVLPKKQSFDLMAAVPDLCHQVALDFMAVRKSKRSPMTATALALITKEADKAGITTAQAIAIAAGRGWQSFKAEWISQDKTFAEKEQDYKDEQAKKHYRTLLTMTDDEKKAWGFQ